MENGYDVDHAISLAESIDTVLRQREVLSCIPDYMPDQPHIDETTRAFLVDWVAEVHREYELRPETLFKAINVIDRFLATTTVEKQAVQLVGASALLVAIKYEQGLSIHPRRLMESTDFAYKARDFIEMEFAILEALEFNLSVPTPYMFVDRFVGGDQPGSNTDLEEMKRVCVFLLQLCLREYVMLKYGPSMLAAAAVYTARCVLRMLPYWNTTLERLTGYTEDQIKPCADLMVRFHPSAAEGKTCDKRPVSKCLYRYFM